MGEQLVEGASVNKVIIAKMGVEGGGITIFGQRVEGVWSFWQEGTSMYSDENDDEDWRSWTTDPVSELSAVLPDEWWMMYPKEIHPDFVEQFRSHYERCRDKKDSADAVRFQHHRWEKLLAGPRKKV